MEFADDLTKRGLDITVVEMLPHCLQLNFDDEFCEKVEERLKEKGVKLLTDTTAEEIGGEVIRMPFKNGQIIKCIGLLTSGGDAPGMNAAIRSVVRTRLGTANAVAIGAYAFALNQRDRRNR